MERYGGISTPLNYKEVKAKAAAHQDIAREHRQKAERLRQRIAAGQLKLDSARSTGKDTSTIEDKLEELRQELREADYTVMVAVAMGLAEVVVGEVSGTEREAADWIPPSGSQFTIHIPNVLSLTASLERPSAILAEMIQDSEGM